MDSAKKEFTSKQKIQFTLFSIFFLLTIILIAGEFTVRFTEKPSPHYEKANPDKRLGWRSKTNYESKTTLKDICDTAYSVQYTTTYAGFRQYANVKSSRPKVFFIGDSYTQSVEVSDDKTFYAILQDSLDIEVFAYGQAGYGNLQHYMILQEHFDEIQPDLVVWQVCSNDFIDNYADLERSCGYKVGLTRPYLSMDGSIYYENPAHTWTSFLRKSKFIDLIFRKIEYTFVKKDEIVGEQRISKEKRSFEPFNQSVLITEKIVEKFKAEIPNTVPVIAFTADIYNPQREEHKRIFQENDIPFYEESAFAVYHAGNNGNCVRARDGYHWNEKGQAVLARELLPILEPLLND